MREAASVRARPHLRARRLASVAVLVVTALVLCSLVVGYSADIAASWIGAEQDRGGVWQVVPAGGGEPVEVDLDR